MAHHDPAPWAADLGDVQRLKCFTSPRCAGEGATQNMAGRGDKALSGVAGYLIARLPLTRRAATLAPPSPAGGEGKEIRRMTSRPKTKSRSLFAAAGLDRDAPRPLTKKPRPQKLSEVGGRDTLL